MLRKSRLALAVALVAIGLCPAAAQSSSGALSTAAASDLQAVFPELVAGFERASGGKVTVSFGSSGNFYAQLQNGAPFDLFFSADDAYPKQLAAAGLADPNTLYTYGLGRLVLWTRKNSGIDLSKGVAALGDARIKHIAVANPEHAPYGRAAVAALKSANMYDQVRARFVLGENISQTAQLAESGNAEVGIIALALALGPVLRAEGRYVEIPPASYPPIEQAAVVMKSSRNSAKARQFLDYLKRPDVRELLQRFGFTPPQPR
jgi:molybdate transport system substrate-binding protein